MITTEQELVINKYLKAKKIDGRILLELKDHFYTQISELMKDKEIGFVGAFLKTKNSWYGELKLVNASLFSFKKITIFEKKMVDKRLNSIFTNSVFAAIAFYFLIWFYPNNGVYIFILLFFGLFLFTIHSLIKKKIKFSEILYLGFHPLVMKIFVLSYILWWVVSPFIFSSMTTNYSLKNYLFLSITSMLIQIQLIYYHSQDKKVLL